MTPMLHVILSLSLSDPPHSTTYFRCPSLNISIDPDPVHPGAMMDIKVCTRAFTCVSPLLLILKDNSHGNTN